MQEAICYVIGAGEFEESMLSPKQEDYVIAVDGGYEYVERMKKRADLIVGDFDSYGHLPSHSNVIRLSSEKDDTDMLFALRKGLEMGYKTFYIYGGLGGRVSHTIGNLQCLIWLIERGAKGYLFHKDVMITAVKNGTIRFEKERQGYVSLFAFGKEARGVTLKHLKYPLYDATITIDYPIGISNEFLEVESEITVTDGILLVVLEAMEKL